MRNDDDNQSVSLRTNENTINNENIVKIRMHNNSKVGIELPFCYKKIELVSFNNKTE